MITHVRSLHKRSTLHVFEVGMQDKPKSAAFRLILRCIFWTLVLLGMRPRMCFSCPTLQCAMLPIASPPNLLTFQINLFCEGKHLKPFFLDKCFLHIVMKFSIKSLLDDDFQYVFFRALLDMRFCSSSASSTTNSDVAPQNATALRSTEASTLSSRH
jgi:hypothetical protein